MTLSIIGKATRSVANLNAFLKKKGCPEYAELYRKAGEKWGVRWDMAIFQSCLETGWFTFPKDVHREQNNFAGLGATGNGVPGDSFPSPEVGIEAQIQDLALRCDVPIKREDVISPYARAQYDTISNRHSRTWEDLTGTWAMDPHYTEKIYSIMKEYDTMFPNENADNNAPATWFNVSTDKGLCVQAMNSDGLAVETLDGNLVEPLIALLSKHKGRAKTWLCGPRKEQAQAPKPPRILLDPGHSLTKPGARSNSGSVKEEVLNYEAALVMQKALLAAGFPIVDIYNPDPDNLTAVGEKAWGYDVVISVHHNSYSGSGNPYHCIMIDPAAPQAWKLCASRLCAYIAKAADGTIADTKVFEGTNGLSGVYEAELTVLNTSAKDPDGKPPFHILPELYFLNKFTDMAACIEVTKKIALSLAEGIAAEFK